MSATAQNQSFTRDGLDYALDLPSPLWRAVSRLDVHEHFEFTYGDDSSNGYLRLRKKRVVVGATPADLFHHDEKWELQSLPGYVACSTCTGENFDGNLQGASFSYEYTSGGRPMAGRIYYLRLDNRTFYALHFTVTADKLSRLRNDMDSIVRSFRLK
jgi:hypothetical protein